MAWDTARAVAQLGRLADAAHMGGGTSACLRDGQQAAIGIGASAEGVCGVHSGHRCGVGVRLSQQGEEGQLVSGMGAHSGGHTRMHGAHAGGPPEMLPPRSTRATGV